MKFTTLTAFAALLVSSEILSADARSKHTTPSSTFKWHNLPTKKNFKTEKWIVGAEKQRVIFCSDKVHLSQKSIDDGNVRLSLRRGSNSKELKAEILAWESDKMLKIVKGNAVDPSEGAAENIIRGAEQRTFENSESAHLHKRAAPKNPRCYTATFNLPKKLEPSTEYEIVIHHEKRKQPIGVSPQLEIVSPPSKESTESQDPYWKDIMSAFNEPRHVKKPRHHQQHKRPRAEDTEVADVPMQESRRPRHQYEEYQF